MILRTLFFTFWGLVTVFLVVFSFKYKDRSKAIIAQVENEAAAISYENPVRVKKIYAVPGQKVDSGELLLEVDHPELMTILIQKETEHHQINVQINELVDTYFAELRRVVNETTREIQNLEQRKKEAEQGQEVNQLDSRIKEWRNYSHRENNRLTDALRQDTSLLSNRKRILDNEIAQLQAQSSYLVTFANFDGTVGNINAQLNELVPAYETILTVYKNQPSIIRAYARAGTLSYIKIGAEVLVKSTNRNYSVVGKVLEIGYRVTEYPDQILSTAQKQYGQEIFIRIPEENEFLNGEQVYVYPPKEK